MDDTGTHYTGTHDARGVGRARRTPRVPDRIDRGQATTEYALVMLAAALVGVLLIGWATAGGGAAAIGRLFDSAIGSVIDQL
ncbi:MAG: hypothetical protein ACO225_01455 [Ilumatobacteraceae bacterium]